MVVGTFHHDNRIIHEKADAQNEGKANHIVVGEPEYIEEYKRHQQ